MLVNLGTVTKIFKLYFSAVMHVKVKTFLQNYFSHPLESNFSLNLHTVRNLLKFEGGFYRNEFKLAVLTNMQISYFKINAVGNRF
jgi:hypothetical protein